MPVQFGSEVLGSIESSIRSSLPAWSLSPLSRVALLNLSENATFRIDPPTGHPVVLRVHRPHYHVPNEIRSEIAWIEALRRDGIVDTPAPLHGRDGDPVQRLSAADGTRDRYAVAFAFARGTEPTDGLDLPGWFGRLGVLTACLHDHARCWTPPSGFQRKTWDWDSMFGPGAHWGDWRAGIGLDGAGTALLGRAIDLIRRRVERFGHGPARFGLIHADLRLANLLVDGPHLRVIDFDDCGYGWRLYDFAAAVSFFEHLPIVDTLRDAWVEGYRSVGLLPDEDADELPVFIAMRRFLLVAWVASHPDAPIAQKLGAGYTLGALDMAERLLTAFA